MSATESKDPWDRIFSALGTGGKGQAAAAVSVLASWCMNWVGGCGGFWEMMELERISVCLGNVSAPLGLGLGPYFPSCQG